MRFFSIWEKTSKKKVRNYMIIAAVIICLLGGGIAGGIAITGDSDADVAKGTDKKVETSADKDESATKEKDKKQDDKTDKNEKATENKKTKAAGDSDKKSKNAGKSNASGNSKSSGNKASVSSGNSGSSGSRPSGSSSSGGSSGSSSSGGSSTPTKPAHVHNFNIPITEPIYKTAEWCSGCGADISLDPIGHVDADPFDACDGSYYGTKQVGTRTVGYKCSCGATR